MGNSMRLISHVKVNVFRSFILIVLLIAICGCSTLGYHETYMLQYKGDLYEQYKNEKEKKGKENKIFEIDAVLPTLTRLYRSNLPFSLTDKYDLRVKEGHAIRAGDPLNIIINKIYLEDSGARPWLLENSGDVAVVVTVDDGRNSEPKHVIVAYEANVGAGVKVPVDDLLAYSIESYNDEPVRIEVTALSLYKVRNKTYVNVLSAAAGIGATIQPAFATAISAASQVGKALIESKENKVLAKFTFELYPWKRGEMSVMDSLGVPRVAYGHYIIIRGKDSAEIGDSDSIHLNYDLHPFRVGPLLMDTTKLKALPTWPVASSDDSYRAPLKLTYIVLTVDNTPLKNAQQIIARADAANRAVAQVANDATLNPSNLMFADAQLTDLKSKLQLLAGQREFNRQKQYPIALESLFRTYENSDVNQNDKNETLRMIRDLMPIEEIPSNILLGSGPELKKWYTENIKNLQYSNELGRYILKKTGGPTN